MVLGLFNLFNWKRLLIEVAVVAALIAIGYWYFNHSQKKIATLEANNAKLTVAVDLQKKTIDSLEEFMAKQARIYYGLQQDLAAAETENAELVSKIAQQDLDSMARLTPDILENTINEDSRRAIQELMDITGAKKP